MIVPESISWPDGLDEQTFLTEYWQQKPLLIKQAFKQFESPLPPDELAGLSLEDDTMPRLITQDKHGHYHLENGPFDSDRFSKLTDNNWSLLVTDVEKHLPELADYLKPFHFIPDWRIDDLMVSYAPEGASVGAHVDEYDVFLLQASGQRRWMIDTSAEPDVSLIPNAALKLLANFVATDTHDLEPGDMLYLPPGMPHHGVAISDNCTTWSVGFRAPTVADTIQSFADMLADKCANQRYKDPPISVSEPGKIDTAALNEFRSLWVKATQIDDKDLANMTGRLLTTSAVDIERPDYADQDVIENRWCKHPFSRLAYTEQAGVTTLFADGEAYYCSHTVAATLCSGRSVCIQDCSENDEQVLRDLIDHGSLRPEDDQD